MHINKILLENDIAKHNGCEDSLTDPNYFNKAYTEACEITAYLCKLYNIDPHGSVTVNGVKIPTILCHQDSYKLGFGGNHGDVYIWFNKHGKNMDNVRNDVAALLKGSTSSKPTSSETSVNYKAKVTANSVLNCRKEPTTNSTVIKTYPSGTILTITKENSGWGYTGEGWVSLNYLAKVTAEEPATKQEEEEEVTYDQWKAFMDQYRAELSKLEAPDWAKTTGEWDKAAEEGIIADKSRPQDLITRSEAAAMIVRATEK